MMSRYISVLLLAAVLSTCMTTAARTQYAVPTIGVVQPPSFGTPFWFWWQGATAAAPQVVVYETKCEVRRVHRPHRLHRRSTRCVRR
jgi:PBP1b-binding outer membrane lipoprotein LpoB